MMKMRNWLIEYESVNIVSGMRMKILLLGCVTAILSCSKEESKGEVNSKPNESPEEVKPRPKRTPYYITDGGKYPKLEVEYLIAKAACQNNDSYSEGEVDPIRSWQDSWVAWEPSGKLLPGREAATPHIWHDGFNMSTTARLGLMVRLPAEAKGLGNVELLDADTGESLKCWRATGVLQRQEGYFDYERSLIRLVTPVGKAWVRFDLDNTIKARRMLFRANVTFDEKKEETYLSELITMAPGGDQVVLEKGPVLTFREQTKFLEAKQIVHDQEKEVYVFDIDKAKVLKKGYVDISPPAQRALAEQGGDCYIGALPFHPERQLGLLLANTVAFEITGEQYRDLTPKQALAYYNSVSHTSGNYSVSSSDPKKPSYWVVPTRQDKLALIKVLPVDDPAKTLKLELRLMAE